MTTYYIDAGVGNDSNAGTSEGAGNAWLTLQKFFDTAAAGDIGWAKAGTSYTEDADVDTTDGTADAKITLEGYTTTTGDGGQITIDGGNSRAHCVSIAGRDHYVIRNVIFTGATDHCIDLSVAHIYFWKFENCLFTDGSGSPDSGFGVSSGYTKMYDSIYHNCIWENMVNDGFGGTYNSGDGVFDACIFRDNGGRGWDVTAYAGYVASFARCIFHDNGEDGLYFPSTGLRALIRNCTFDNNAGHGIYHNGHHGAMISVSGCIFSNQTGVGKSGVHLDSGTWSGNNTSRFDYNAYYNNTADTNDTTLDGSNDISLSAAPYAGSGDYDLNDTAGGGADCRSAGPSGEDIGAVQHADPAGGGTTSILGSGDLRGGF